MMGVMNPLQELIQTRLTELDLSQRAAAARSQDLLTAATLNRILKGHHSQITSRVIAGLALALNVPESVVAKAAKETAMPARWEELSRLWSLLDPDRRELVARTLEDARADQVAQQRKQLEKDHPNRARRTRR